MSRRERLLFVAGPCVVETEELTLEIAGTLKEITASYDVELYFKASFDKANRTAATSYRGPGIEEGLAILGRVRSDFDVPILSDIHETDQVSWAAQVLDVLQIPAYLSRQTDLLEAAGRAGKIVNIKKAQFMAPEDVQYAAQKVSATGNDKIWLTERGASFGYHNLVVDFRSFSVLSATGFPVIFDATHSVQIPSKGGTSSGNREYVIPLARAAAAYGIDGLFTEVHPNPERALSDGSNSLRLRDVPRLLDQLLAVRTAL
jgi:2-dehydro-3-deoxyphosphooctonate aldolase (KDO 8-P synthase)